MKIRKGFVSNSSSSSFIISSHSKIESAKDVDKHLLPDSIALFRSSRYDWKKKESIYQNHTREEISETIFGDMKSVTLEEAIKFSRNHGYDDCDNRLYGSKEKITVQDKYNFMTKEDDHKEDEDKITNEETIERFVENMEPFYNFYITGASDEDGAFWSFMEHDIYPGLAFEVFSHH